MSQLVTRNVRIDARIVAVMAALAVLLSFAIPAGSASAMEPEQQQAATPPADHASGPDDGEGEVGAEMLREFTVWNGTISKEMKFHGSTSMPGWSGPYFDQIPSPSPGSTWPGGRKNVFSLTFKPFMLNGTRMTYSLNNAIVWIDAGVDSLNIPYVSCAGGDSTVRCEMNSPTTVTLSSTTPHTTTIGPENPARQLEKLNEVCGNPDFLGSCRFQAKGDPVKAFAPREIIDESTHVNCRNSGEDSKERRFQREVGGWTTTTIGGELGFKAFDVVSASLTVSHAISSSWSRTYVESHVLKVNPRSKGWFDYYAPIMRVVGDFTVTVGSDTLLIPDVSFDAPSELANHPGAVVSREEKLTAEEAGRLCDTEGPDLP